MIPILMILMCFLTASGQILVKKGINRKEEKGISPLNLRYFSDPAILGGGVMILAAPLVYLNVLRRIGLTGAFGLNGLSYIVVYVLGLAVLKEKGSRIQTAGIALISLGVAIWSI